MKFKRQTNRSTKMDEATNINIFLKDFSFGIVGSKYWGDFSENREDNPLIEIELYGKYYRIELTELKRILEKNLWVFAIAKIVMK